MNDVTRILSDIEHGDPQAAEQLLPLVDDELRNLAAAKLAQEKPRQTVQATALVHDALSKLAAEDKDSADPVKLRYFAGRDDPPRRHGERQGDV
jgi:hypothetical protein